MKVGAKDYLTLTAAITALGAVSVGGVWLVSGVTRSALGPYHVVADAILLLVLFGVASAGLLRLLLAVKPVLPGRYESTSPMVGHWMLLTVVYRLGQGALRPWVPFFMRPLLDVAFGARVGHGPMFGGTIDDPYMVQVGDEVVLGNASLVSGNFLQGGVLTCGRVSIGSRVTVGANCVIYPDVEIGDGATLVVGSCVLSGTRIGPGETWRGNPARKWL